MTYRDIKADILGRITRGDWTPGSLIPGETELAATYGAARATVNRAMRELAQDGIIERKRKSGSRVRLSPLRQARFDIPVVRHEVEAAGHAYRHAVLLSEVGPPPVWLAARMALSPDETVRHVVCLHYADDRPWQHEDRWINADLLPQAVDADFAVVTPTEWLVAQIPFSSVEIAISATAAEAGLAAQMGCAPGAALLLTERLTRWDGRSVTHVRLVNRPGHRMTTRY